MDKKEVSSDEEHFEDCCANEKIVNELIENAGINLEEKLKIDESDSEKHEQEKEIFEDCQGTADDLIDDESQRDFEKDLTEEEKLENKNKAEELKKVGNEHFKNSEFEKSVEIYTSALKLCPVDCSVERAVLYANRAAAKAKLDLKPTAIDDCSKALEFNPKYVKALLR
jgi:tetratricopeptide (TPR) repeat protein